MDEDYPKLISKGFAGVPNDIDAVFVWSGNGKIYFFKVTGGCNVVGFLENFGVLFYTI